MATEKGAMRKQSSHIVESYFGIHVLEEIDIIFKMSISCYFELLIQIANPATKQT